MVNVLGDLEQAALWQSALAGEPDWERIFDGFQATVDWPGGYFYRELADHYPEAKVLLSVREPSAWAESMRETVWAVRHGESLTRLLSSAQAHVNPEWAAFLGMIDSLLWQDEGTFAAGHGSAGELIDGWDRHVEQVKRSISPERLLVWDVAEGWDPLCEFLALPVPDVPLPHINDRAEFLNRIADSSLAALNAWRAGQALLDAELASE